MTLRRILPFGHQEHEDTVVSAIRSIAEGRGYNVLDEYKAAGGFTPDIVFQKGDMTCLVEVKNQVYTTDIDQLMIFAKRLADQFPSRHTRLIMASKGLVSPSVKDIAAEGNIDLFVGWDQATISSILT